MQDGGNYEFHQIIKVLSERGINDTCLSNEDYLIILEDIRILIK